MAEKIVVKRLAQPGENVDAQPDSKQTPAPAGGRDADVPQKNQTKAVSPAAAKRRKLFVHIGMPKTGTTSIQYYLHANMQRLNNVGMLYPSTGRHARAHVQHALLAEAFSEAPIVSGDFALKAEVDGPLIVKALLHEIELAGMQSVVLSSESLCMLTAEGVSRFADAFRGFDIIPLVYIRNFCDLSDASYQTAVIHNMTTQSYRELNFDKLGLTIDLVSMCRRWADIAHDRKIAVQNYDDPAHKNSIFSFTELVGIDRALMDNTLINSPLNTSVTATQVVIKRDLRNAGIEMRSIDSLLSQIARLPINEKQTLVPPDVRPGLAKAYVEQLKALSECDFVTGLKVSPEMLIDDGSTEKIFIPNIQQAMFAIGRAIARAKFQT